MLSFSTTFMQELNSYVIETMQKSKSLNDRNQINSLYQIHDQIDSVVC